MAIDKTARSLHNTLIKWYHLINVMNKFNDDTNFLFADPDFVTGFATVIDFGGTLPVYNESANDLDADTRAIASDWAIIGKDIKESVENFEKKERQAA